MFNKSLSISYIDFLWAFLATVILVLLVSKNAENQKGNIIDPSQFLIEMTWGDKSYSDVDLWVANPNGEMVFFRDRNIGGMTLDTDNLGVNNRVLENGSVMEIKGRREVVSIRAVIPGTYTVNVMMYAFRSAEPENVKVTIRKLNPYSEIYEKSVTLDIAGQEETILSFDIDKNGKVVSIDTISQASLFNRLKS